jgi:hypothetical protein
VSTGECCALVWGQSATVQPLAVDKQNARLQLTDRARAQWTCTSSSRYASWLLFQPLCGRWKYCSTRDSTLLAAGPTCGQQASLQHQAQIDPSRGCFPSVVIIRTCNPGRLQFDHKEYWQARFYSNPEPFEWYRDFEALQPVLSRAIDVWDRVLHVGVGTSTVQESMAQAGYQRIVNVDYCSECATAMHEHWQQGCAPASVTCLPHIQSALSSYSCLTMWCTWHYMCVQRVHFWSSPALQQLVAFSVKPSCCLQSAEAYSKDVLHDRRRARHARPIR